MIVTAAFLGFAVLALGWSRQQRRRQRTISAWLTGERPCAVRRARV